MARDKVQNVTDLIERLMRKAKGHVSIDDMLKEFGSRAYDPLLFIVALVLVSPIGGLPGATAILGTFIILVAGQSLFTDTPWLPRWLRERKASASKAKRWMKKILPALQKMEKLTRPRLTLLTTGWMKHASSLLIVIIGASTYLLGLVPGGLILPGLSIALLAIARLHQDGLLMAFGMFNALCSFALLGYALYDSVI